MTKQEVIDFINAQLVIPVNQVVKIKDSFFKVLDFLTESTVTDIIPTWTALLTFNLDGTGDGKYCIHADTNAKKRIWSSKTAANIGNSPPTDPNITSNAYWEEISQSGGSGIKEWTAGIYGTGLVVVYHEHSSPSTGRNLYLLIEPVRPFNSTNIETEITAGKWLAIGKTYSDFLNNAGVWKHWANAATTANIVLSGAQTVDGIALVAGNICLVKNQTDPTQNGFYNVQAGAWTRSTFGIESFHLEGAVILVLQGAANAKKIFKQVTFPVTLGTSNIVFEGVGDDYFKGYYTSLANLQAAIPTGEPGDYAIVDTGAGSDAQQYIWDIDAPGWKLSSGAPVPNASETIQGVVEEGTDAELQAGTAAGGTGARLFVNPFKLATWWTWVKTQAATISGAWTFLTFKLRNIANTFSITFQNTATADRTVTVQDKDHTIAATNDFIGKQDIFIPASAMWARITAGCSTLTQVEIATSLVNIQALDFDTTTQEFAQFHWTPPRNWDRGTIKITPYWTAASGTGGVVWGCSGGSYSDDDALSTALGVEQTSADTLILANDMHVGPQSAAITIAGVPADADFIVIQVSRNPADVNDTLAVDARLVGIMIELTTDAGVAV